MQAIPEIISADIVQDSGVGYEFEVNPISVTGYAVSLYKHAVAFPHMNAVSCNIFIFGYAE
jgi:hypothetical protein